MTDSLTPSRVRQMLEAAHACIALHHEYLSRLDAAVGGSAAEHTGAGLQAMLSAVAWAVMGCDGGSAGPLLGSWFQGMSDAVAGRLELDASAAVSMVEAGVAAMQKQSRAQIGDKTMMDALLPALAALRAVDPAAGLGTAFDQAAAAAARGAEATAAMRAKFGRARHLGDRTLGHPDPGAVSISLIFEGFREALSPGTESGLEPSPVTPP